MSTLILSIDTKYLGRLREAKAALVLETLAIYLIYSRLSAQNRFEDKENVCYFAHVTTIPVVDCRESRLRTFYDGLGEPSSVRSSSNAVSFRTDFIITFGSTMIWTPPQRRKSGKEYLFGTWKLTHEAWFEFWARKILLYLGRSERIVSISSVPLRCVFVSFMLNLDCHAR